ncbi:FixH family protein [Echinimonas agarilytica]|uniref:FixH family protein n=1 Tax=Echinimonas agarilytica TaxID=1215918 RepID=A0AA42B8P1_9GAMM|nr:FixH family protein [Echinimonas agarilytica]
MTRRWYKQFWPWFLIFLPMCAVVASFTTLYIAIGAQQDMVVDDYYKKGKAINFQKDKQNAAMALKLSVDLALQPDAVAIDFVTGASSLDGSALEVNFYHTTLASKDFTVLAVKDARGQYKAPLTQEITGKWRVTIEPYDAQWRLRKTLKLPLEQTIHIDPLSH